MAWSPPANIELPEFAFIYLGSFILEKVYIFLLEGALRSLLELMF